MKQKLLQPDTIIMKNGLTKSVKDARKRYDIYIHIYIYICIYMYNIYIYNIYIYNTKVNDKEYYINCYINALYIERSF